MRGDGAGGGEEMVVKRWRWWPVALLNTGYRPSGASFAFSLFLVKVFSSENVSTVDKALENIPGMETSFIFPCPFTTALAQPPP